MRRLAGRTEFVTAYTPYQPEVAQGVLQALFEYQTMVARLSGLEIANASLYDGATALVEAVNLAVAATGRQQVWLSDGVHRTWAEVVRTFAAGTGHDIDNGAAARRRHRTGRAVRRRAGRGRRPVPEPARRARRHGRGRGRRPTTPARCSSSRSIPSPPPC